MAGKKGMKRGSRKNAKANAANGAAPGPGHNIEAISEDEKFALGMHHVRKINAAEAKKKAADADLKNTWKIAKADGVQEQARTIRALEKDGIDPVQARITLEIETAQRMGMPIDMPKGLFDKPSDGQAYTEGKLASMRGDPAKPPYGPDTADHDDWMKGFEDGTTLMNALTEPKPTAEIVTKDDEDEGEAQEPAGEFDDALEDADEDDRGENVVDLDPVSNAAAHTG